MKKSLDGLRVLDLSRVLAGPVCTQILGDLGAQIIKVEKPGAGDDTRYWGPPFLQDNDGNDTSESAYYLSCNRNKKSVAIDISTPEGQALIHNLLEDTDILIENFKVEGLAKFSLDYEQLKDKYPALIYAAISGFGQNGPQAKEPGYDFLAQGMAGLMAATGGPDQEPTKVGVALSDTITGLYAAIGILAALQSRHASGKGQMVDVSLVDCTLASMTNLAQYFLTSGTVAPRLGNAHSAIVPYQAFEAADGHIILSVGNDRQFARFATFAGKPEWADDPRFATNSARVLNRDALVPQIKAVIAARPMAHWIEGLHGVSVPCGPVNTMDKVFEEPQLQARDMRIQMPHPYHEAPIDLVGSPLKLSGTPVSYDHTPPVLGQHTREILQNLLQMSEGEIQDLERKGIIGS